MNAVSERLAGGPARGLAPVSKIVHEAAHSPSTRRELVAALGDERPIVQSRAANALKKLQAQQPQLVVPYASRILRATLRCEVLEARWNLTIVTGSLPLRGRNRMLAVDLLFEALDAPSPLLRTFALQGLVNQAAQDRTLQARVRPILTRFATYGTAAMRARARKLSPLLGEFERKTPKARRTDG